MADRDAILRKRVVFSIPGMDAVRVRRDLVYKRINDADLRCDLYTPAGTSEGARLPAVIFVHGDGSPEVLTGPPNSGPP